MALELYVAGPGIDLRRQIAPGEPALVLGRDPECSLCLPDPQRGLSRRHLSLWNEGEVLQFQVLSMVNGVQLGARELPPGARGVLPPGEALTVSAYQLRVGAAPAADPADPWAEFERQAAGLVQTGPPPADVHVPTEDDPFGDWGFHSTFGPGSPGGALHAEALAPATDLRPFFQGLGLPELAGRAMTQGEMAALGRTVRIALEGLLQAMEEAAGPAPEGEAGEATRSGGPAWNPLQGQAPLADRLAWLFGARMAPGALPPERAVAQLVADLLAHQQATVEATRGTVQGVVQEFAPEALKARLLRGGPRLLGAGRAWEAFSRDYAEQAKDLPAWVRRLMDRHFSAARARALLRAKRDTSGPSRG